MTLVELFENRPSAAELLGALSENEPFTSPTSESLKVYTAILQYHIIPTFAQNEKVMAEIARFFCSPVGLGYLISHLNVCPAAEAQCIVDVLELLLESKPQVLQYLLNISKKETTTLLFGSRILNAVASKTNVNSWLASPVGVSEWLGKQFVTSEIIDHTLFDRGVKIGAPTHFVRPFLTHVELLKSNFAALRPIQQKFALKHGIITLLPKDPSKIAKFLIDIDTNGSVLVELCKQTLPDQLLIRSTALILKEEGTLVKTVNKLLSEWSSSSFISLIPTSEQQCLTQLIIASCCYLSRAEAHAMSLGENVINGVTNHLQSSSSVIRNMGTLIGELLAKQSGAKLEFGIDYSGDYNWWIGIDHIDHDYTYKENSNLDHTHSIEQSHSSSQSEHLSSILHHTAADSDDEDDIADDDADSDEEIEPPYYLKDLLEFLRSDKYAEVHIALTTGSDLILRKANFGSEVPQYADELLRAACSLGDKFSIKEFGKLRQSLLNAIVIADPAQASRVVHMFSTGDWSLAQRQSLLASLANAAHSLASGGVEVEDMKLPEAVHRMFISSPNNSNQRLPGTSRPLESSTLPSGKVTRRSKRLETGSGPLQQKKISNMFSPIAASFFYPLINAQPPLRQVSYDAIVFAQWLRTLGVFVADAYPNSDAPAMTGEMWALLKSILLANTSEPVILEAVYANILIIIETGSSILLNTFAGDLGAMFDLVVSTSNTDGNSELTPQAATLGRAAASQLAKLIQKLTGGV